MCVCKRLFEQTDQTLSSSQGGYNLLATANSALAVAKVLLGDEVPDLPPMEASDIAVEVVYQLAKIHSKYWKNIDVRACEPLLGEKLYQYAGISIRCLTVLESLHRRIRRRR